MAVNKILVNKTSTAADTSESGFTDVVGLFEASVTVQDSSSVILMIASGAMDQGDATDRGADFRFAVDDTLEGPEISRFGSDAVDEGCGFSICWALTGLSGSHKFALQWRTRSAAASMDTGRTRSFQVIEIVDATILVNKTSTATDTAAAGFTDIVGLTDTQTVAGTGSILLLLGNMSYDDGGTENMAAFRFTIAGAHQGPELTAWADGTDEICGQSMLWMHTGISGSTAFAFQWDEIDATGGAVTADTTRVRSFQVIEITANANLPTNITSQAADALTGSYTDVVGLVDTTVDVDAASSILLFAAGVQQVIQGDTSGVYRIFEGGTGEGPETYVFNDKTTGGCGHSVYWAVEGKSAGNHSFSLRGANTSGTVDLATDRNRSLCILELLASSAQTISPTAIATLEAFGTTKLNLEIEPTAIATAESHGSAKVNLQVDPSAIAGAEAFGSTTLLTGNVDVSPGAIGSAEAFGTTQLNLELLPAGVGSAEVFGAAKINLQIEPGAVGSLETFGATVVVGNATVSPSAIPTGELLGTPKLNLQVAPGAIASAEAFGTAQLNLTIFPGATDTAEAFGTAVVLAGPVTVTPGAIASGEVFGAPTLTLGFTITPSAIASLEAFGTAQLNLTLSPSAIASLEAVGTAALNLTIFPGATGSAEAFGTAVLVPGGVTITPSPVGSAEAFGTAQLNLGILPASIVTAEAFGAATLTLGVVTISPVAIPSLEIFGTAAVATALTFVESIDGELLAIPAVGGNLSHVTSTGGSLAAILTIGGTVMVVPDGG